jgi:hypothetical protein
VVMGVAIAAIPGWSRLVFLIPAAGGAVWAFVRARRSGKT